MAEGVQNRALKLWDEFVDPDGLEGALWFEGVPIVREHPPSYVTHLTPKIGRVRNVQPDEDSRRVPAEAVLFNSRLTPDEMKKVEAGEMLGGSIGYWSEDEPLDSPQIWADNGEEYDVVQRAPYFADHFAMVQDPACPVGVCGFNVNSKESDSDESDSLKSECKSTEVNDLPEKSDPVALEQPKVDEQNPPQSDPKPPEVDEQKDQKQNPVADTAEAPEGNSKDGKAQPETDPGAGSKQPQTPVVEMDSKLADKFRELEAKVNSQSEEIKILKDEKAARDAAVKAEQDEQAKAGFGAILNQNAKMDIDKLWPEYQKNPALWIAQNQDKLDLRPAGDSKVEPIGQAFVVHGDDMDAAGVTPVAKLTEKYYPGASTKDPEKERKEGR